MKVLVTGGAGYLGSIMVEHLLAYGDHVTVLDSFVHGANSLAHLASNLRLDIVAGDVRDMSVLALLMKTHDAIVPLAAVVGAAACERDQVAATSTNFQAVVQLCKLASKEQRIVFPNTNSGYGTTGAEACTEETPLRPLSLYADSKARAEQAVMQRENSIALRLATVFGASPRMRTDLLVNDFVLRAVHDRSLVLFEPHARRNYIHVRDVAHAFAHCLDEFDTMRGQVYNCGNTAENRTKKELAAAIAMRTPLTVLIGEGADSDKRDYLVSNAKLEATGWGCRYSLDFGIVELLKLYRGLRTARYANV